MSLDESVVEGTLKQDGTLELDEKPRLTPGRVTVLIRSHAELAPPPEEDLWQFMQRTRRELEASGRPFMNDQEVTAYIEELRESDPIDEMLKQVDEKLKRAEPKRC